jgi:hypothetical protein
MTQTHVGRLKNELERAAAALKAFEDFRSPVNQAVVEIIQDNRPDGWIVRVAIREDHGTFYQGRITGQSARGNWVVLTDDGELVHEVTADMFVSVRLVPKPE